MEQFKDVNRRKSKPKEKLNIAMFGQKRIPSREGGVEIVVEELCTRMVQTENMNWEDLYLRNLSPISQTSFFFS